MQRRSGVVTKVMMLFVLCACSGSSGPRQPKMAQIPSGKVWFCSEGLVKANMCFRDEDECKTAAYELVQAGQTAPGATVRCVTATTATCATFKSQGKETFMCTSQKQACNDLRYTMARNSTEVANTISVCKDMP